MKVVAIRGAGGPEVLAIEERASRALGPGEVRVEVAAAGLNRADVLQRKGFYPAPKGIAPDVPGLEYAGAIVEVGGGIDPLRVAIRYRSKEGAVFDEFPYHQSILHSAQPEYEELPGFDADITACRGEADLPPQARDYLNYIADSVGVPIRLVGVGPGRDQVVWIGDEPSLRAA